MRLFLTLIAIFVGAVSVGAQAPDPETVSFDEACGGITLENQTPSELCLAVMAARPAPSYPQIQLDSATINSYSFYKVTGENANVYSAP